MRNFQFQNVRGWGQAALGFLLSATAMAVVFAWASGARAAGPSFAESVAKVQPKIVKIYGAGGLRGLEHYQSGFLISADGHILTAWSYVLDTDFIAAVLHDGRRYDAKLLGADPRLEIAIIKIDAMELPHFNLDNGADLGPGDRVLAFSNIFGVAAGDEPATVLHGSVSAKTALAARRGAFQTPYHGPVYVLDAMTNNPGAAGGALTDRRGRLAGVLGKELKNAFNDTYLNYALPVAEVVDSVHDILAGRIRTRRDDESAKKPAQPLTLPLLGLRLAPNILPKTPPFLERVRPGSPAAKAGLKVDDLILFVNGRIVTSFDAVQEELSFIDRIDEVRLVVERDNDLIEAVLRAED